MDRTSSKPVRDAPIPRLAVARQSFERTCFLILIPIKTAANGEEIWTSINGHIRHQSVNRPFVVWTQKLFTRTVVGTANVQQAVACHEESSMPSFRVSLQGFEQDTLFTEAFENPRLLSQHGSYIFDNQSFIFPSTISSKDVSGQRIIVIRKTLDKEKITWLLAFLLVIAPGVGFLVGVYSHKPEVGVAVSAGIFALASFIQGLAAWFHA